MKIVYLISKNDNLSLFPTKRVSSISRLNGMSVWMNGEGSYAWRCESAFLLNESILQKADSIQILKKIYMEVSRIIDSASGIRVFIHLGGLSFALPSAFPIEYPGT